MGVFRQVIRSVEYYYPAGFAAALAVAAAMAALTGSLFVGGSVERSLKETALERLGDINYSVSTAGYFRESLAENIYKNITPSGGELTAPAIILTGTVSNLSSGITVPNVNIIGVNEEFFGLYEAAFRKGEKVNGRKAAMSKALGDIFGDLRLRPDQNIIVTLQKTGLAPRESIFGRQKTEEAVIKARFESSGTLPAYGPGAFNLKNEAAPPRNLYVSLSFLQSLLGLEGKANTVLAAFVNKNTDFSEAVKKALTLKDYGLKTVKGRACFYLESENLLLSDYLAKKASEAAVKAGLKAGKASVYLVKTVNGKMPYSVLAGFEDFPVRQGAVALSPWAQEDLGAAEGGLLKVVFLKGSGKAGVREESRDYIAAGTLPEKYLDPDIVPKFEGITDAGSMADWNPTFKVEHSLIRPKDENYWKDFKTTPKAAVSFGEAVSYWKEESPAYSGVTSVRVEGDENIFTDTLLGLLEPGPGGITVANTAAEALAGSRPSSDYSGLFTALSAFIVFSALGLVWLIFGLLAEKRSAETGLLLAFGFGENRVLRILLFEGAVYAFFGVLLGLILSFYYTDYFVNLLSRSWKSAGVEIGVFKPYYGAGAGFLGAFLSFCLSGLALYFSVKKSAAGTPVTLLNRRQERVFLPKPGKNKLFHYFAAAAALSIALGLAKIISPVSAFFLGGALALVSGIMVFDTLMKRAVVSGVTGLALRSVFFNRKRSLLAVSLIASAAFIMIIVSAAVKNPEAENVYAPSSGSGGFDLAAGSEVPLFFDLNTAEGRKLNGMEESPRYKGMEAFMLRLRKGEDISCLNLGQPSDPGVLGVPAELIKRGGFKAGNFLKNLPRGWEALNAELPGGAIPAFADANSLQWILHKKVGDEITAGGARLKIVGTLSESIFAGELLVAEKNFVKVYGASGYNYFLFKCLPEEHAEALKILRTALPLAGFDVRETKDILKRYASIQNIYIMTFKLLGGLGFLLGILGITAVMLKSVLERKSEFAVMRSFGYSAGSLVLLVLAENTLLMLAGFLIGGISAVIAALPQALSGAGNFDWTGSFGFITLVFAAGLTACAAGAFIAMRGDPVRSLRSE